MSEKEVFIGGSFQAKARPKRHHLPGGLHHSWVILAELAVVRMIDRSIIEAPAA